MTKNFLKGDDLPRFLEILAGYGELHGPVRSDDGVITFRPLCGPADLLLDYHRTLIPPKKYLLPPRETILAYAPESGYRQPGTPAPKIVLLGVHPCDLAGIAYLDRVFLGNEPDPLYDARRSALTLIGLSCEPDDSCFCGDRGVSSAGDLFAERTGGGLSLTSMSRRGSEILEKLSPFLAEKEPPSSAQRACSVLTEITLAAARQETFRQSPLWDDFAARCLSCGACSLCCPTCYCFDVLECGALDGKTATRLREWDNCLFRAHGEVAGGHNFRKDRRERFRYRYRHKYLGFGPTRGEVACVGCGRCREVCPAGIDLLELFTGGCHETGN